MTPLVETACPGCKHPLQVPASYLNKTLRCKHCGQLVKLSGKVPAAVEPPAEVPSPLAATAAPVAMTNPPTTFEQDGNLVFRDFSAPVSVRQAIQPSDEETQAYLGRKQLRQRRVLVVSLSLALVLLLGLGVCAIVFHKQLGAVWAKLTGESKPSDDDDLQVATNPGTKPAPTKPEGSVPLPPVTRPPPPDTKPIPPRTRPSPPETKPVGPRPPSKFAAAYRDAARAMVIGVRGYQNAPVLNPTYAVADPKKADPLGVNALAGMLVKDLGFRGEAVGVLSDTANATPVAPGLEEMKFNLERFFKGCRAQDRVVLAFVGHVAVIEDKGYLVPVDGDPAKKETLLPIAWLYEKLDVCPSRHKLLLFDVGHHIPAKAEESKLPAAFVKQLQDDLPKEKGVQVWLSCSAGEHAYGFEDASHNGNVFMYHLVENCGLISTGWDKLRDRADIKEGKLPLAGFHEAINSQMTEYLKSRSRIQTSLLFGAEKADAGAFAVEPLAAVLVTRAPNSEQPAAAKSIEAIFAEMKLKAPGGLPVFSEKSMEPFKPDYANDAELQEIIKKNRFRKAVAKANAYLDEKPFTGPKGLNLQLQIPYPGNDMAFKNQLEPLRKKSADVCFDAADILTELREVEKMRDDEKSPRWKAHYDLTLSRMLTRASILDDYKHIIGNKLFKDAPMPKPGTNSFKISPADGPTSKDGQANIAERNKALDRIEKEFPKTPWAILGKQERNAVAGYALE